MRIQSGGESCTRLRGVTDGVLEAGCSRGQLAS